MEKINYNEHSIDIILTPNDVESAVRQFVTTCYPELAKDWIINPKYNVGTIIVAGTKL